MPQKLSVKTQKKRVNKLGAVADNRFVHTFFVLLIGGMLESWRRTKDCHPV